MNEISLKYKDYFEKSYAEHGESIEAVGWNAKSQRQRFEVLCQIGDLEGKNILDVGCGFGDLYKFLGKENISINRYLGIDINERFTRIARKRYPDTLFYCGDILDFQPPESIDYSLASGIFFLSDPQWEEHFIAVCKKLLHISNVGIGFNLLSIYSEKDNSGQYFASPWKILKLAMEKISLKIVLRHDYRSNDFTIFIYKDNQK